MAYTKKVWKDAPDTSTPINAANLNHMEDGIAEANVNAQNALDRLDDVDDEITQINSDLTDGVVPVHLTPIWSSSAYTNRTVWLYRIGKTVYYQIDCKTTSSKSAGDAIIEFNKSDNGVNGIKADQTQNSAARKGFLMFGTSVSTCFLSISGDRINIKLSSSVPTNSEIHCFGSFLTN